MFNSKARCYFGLCTLSMNKKYTTVDNNDCCSVLKATNYISQNCQSFPILAGAVFSAVSGDSVFIERFLLAPLIRVSMEKSFRYVLSR